MANIIANAIICAALWLILVPLGASGWQAAASSLILTVLFDMRARMPVER